MNMSRRDFFVAFLALIPLMLGKAVGRAASACGISIPFNTLPMNMYIRGPRYMVMFDRIVTPRWTNILPTSVLRASRQVGKTATITNRFQQHKVCLDGSQTLRPCAGV